MKPTDSLTPSGHDLDKIVISESTGRPHSIRQTVGRLQRLADDPRTPDCVRVQCRFYLARFAEKFGYRRERRLALACGFTLALLIVLLVVRIWICRALA